MAEAVEGNQQEPTLEEATNALYGQEGVPQLNEARLGGETTEGATEPETAEGSPAPTQSGQESDINEEERNFLKEIRAIKEVSGTPFKSPSDLVKAYKDLQSQWTKDHEFVTKVKPHEQLLSDMGDPNFANFLQQAAVLYKNPNLASAYVNPNGQVNSLPDPRQYNMYDDSDLQRYQKDLSDYQNRQFDSRINARLSAQESQMKLEKMKSDLKTQFPDANPDDVLSFVNKRGNDWSLSDAYKIANYDNLKTQALESARKELTQKLETAQKTTTPTASASPKGGVKVEDIIAHIGRYGGESARKKFGESDFTKAMKMASDSF